MLATSRCGIIHAREKSQEYTKEEWAWTLSVELGRALMDERYGDILAKIGRHETTLMNAFAKTLHQLILFQRDRANDNRHKLQVIALPPAAE